MTAFDIYLISILDGVLNVCIVPNIESAKDKLYNEYKDELEKYDVVEAHEKEK